MKPEIQNFIHRNGGWARADGMVQLLTRWDRAADQVARWRREQIALGALGPDWTDFRAPKNSNHHSN